MLQGEGLSIRKIAKELGRSPSSISKELNAENLEESPKIKENVLKELEQGKIY